MKRKKPNGQNQTTCLLLMYPKKSTFLWTDELNFNVMYTILTNGDCNGTELKEKHIYIYLYDERMG